MLYKLFSMHTCEDVLVGKQSYTSSQLVLYNKMLMGWNHVELLVHTNRICNLNLDIGVFNVLYSNYANTAMQSRSVE